MQSVMLMTPRRCGTCAPVGGGRSATKSPLRYSRSEADKRAHHEAKLPDRIVLVCGDRGKDEKSTHLH
eukprot:6177195-Pleurochrysis_carterae.AAC.2